MQTLKISSLISIVVLFFIISIITYVKSRAKNKVEKDSTYIKGISAIRLLNLFGIIVVTFAGVGLFLDIILEKNDLIASEIVILALCYAVLFVLLMYSVNWEIEINEDFCNYTNMFGIKKKYFYKDLIIKKMSEEYSVFFNYQRVFGISTHQKKWEKFVDAYKKTNDLEIQ